MKKQKLNELPENFSIANCRTWIENDCSGKKCSECPEYRFISDEELQKERGE